MSVDPTLVERARVHAALGDPVRLAVVDLLGLSDRSPGELVATIGLPGNLLAHHLRVLEDAGVVERTRSEGDRRRTYVRLVPGRAPAAAPVHRVTAPRVVFVCTHNSARSQLAAATWADRSAVPVTSAGTRPAAHVHPRAAATARRHGLQLAGDGSTRHVDDTLRAGDLVVAVCDSAHESLHGEHMHWSVPDPVRIGTDSAFEDALDVIHDRVGRLLAAVTPIQGESA